MGGGAAGAGGGGGAAATGARALGTGRAEAGRGGAAAAAGGVGRLKLDTGGGAGTAAGWPCAPPRPWAGRNEGTTGLATAGRDGTGADDEYFEPDDSWMRLWMCSGVTSS